MSLRSPRVLALLPFVLLAAGCQDYNFNPVGHCLIQPGTERVTLSSISTADVLFVVDDSGSMAGEQQKLAQNFSAFITNLDATNAARKAAGLDPIDFHVAVTTTSIFINNPTTASCSTSCPGATGPVCCTMSGATPLTPYKTVKSCTSDAQCGAGTTCKDTCTGFAGEKICCDASNVPPRTESVACTAGQAAQSPPAACGDVQRHFRFDGSCAPGNASNGGLYPHGAFVGYQSNPRVLHFDKELYGATAKNKQGMTSQQLIDAFAKEVSPGNWQGNVIVGTCGSGQEQGLQASRLAVQKALAGLQKDGAAAAEWPHPNSKLVVVYVGDEDDCSSPEDPVSGVILTGSPGADTCVSDATPSGAHKQYPVSDILDYFSSLNRPLGAAFIVSTQSDTCTDQSCTPGFCCDYACTGSTSTCRDQTCGGQAPGVRFLLDPPAGDTRLPGAAPNFRSRGADVVAGSICDNDFASILDRIAEIVKPPSGLVLPTAPAAGEVTLLRIADSRGFTRKTCKGPAPVGTSGTALAQYDWWFTSSRDATNTTPSSSSKFVFINHSTANCEANPGETYSADYLGRLPEGGCTSPQQCATALGGTTDVWDCYVPPGETLGTCLCK